MKQWAQGSLPAVPADGEQVNLLRGPAVEQVVLQWRSSAADRLVGLEVCCDDALCLVGRCRRAFENDRTCGW